MPHSSSDSDDEDLTQPKPEWGDATVDSGRNDADLTNALGTSADSVPVEIHSGAIHTGANEPRQTFGDYVLLEEIARGGMGVIFRAEQKGLKRPVALKMILAGQLASEDEVRRFFTEAEAAAKLDHPHIVPVYDVGEINQTHYFSMKLIQGEDFGRQLKTLRKDLRSAVAILEKVCRAVAHAHQRGVLHRDLKPANILLDEDLEPYLTDLGLARSVGGGSDVTKTGAIVGTPSYMSPEQASGKADLTTATDIYALGAILYEVLCGYPPFRGATPMETVMKVIQDDPVSPSASGATDRSLEQVALKCLDKNPDNRYSSASALADDLRRWRMGEPIGIRAPSLTTITRTWFRKNFGTAAWTLVVGIVGGGLSSLCVWNATAQREISSSSEWVYGTLASQEVPNPWMTWKTPEWIMMPALLGFVAIFSLLGFFTAWLVRTRNTGADIAAGLTVGVIASASAFFFGLATLTINVGFQNPDLTFLSQLALAPEDQTPVPVLDYYPEFADLERAEQVDLLRGKIKIDRYASTSRGLLLAAIACGILYLFAGVVETMIAGPRIRRSSSIWRGFVSYLFSAAPFIAGCIFLGFHVAIRIVFGGSGMIYDLRTGLLCAGFLIAMIAQFRDWRVSFRAPLTALSCGLLVYFLVSDFGLLPEIARGRVDIRLSEKRAASDPDNLRLQVNVIDKMMLLGVAYYEADRMGSAKHLFARGIRAAGAVPEAMRNESFDRVEAVAHSNYAYTIRNLDGGDAAAQWLIEQTRSHPTNEHLPVTTLRYFLQNDQPDRAEKWLRDFTVGDPVQFRALRRMWYEQQTANRSAEAESIRAATESLRERWSDESPINGLGAKAVNRGSLLQRWTLVWSGQFEQGQELPASVSKWMAGERNGISNFQSPPVRAFGFDPIKTDLRKVFPDAADHTSAFAVGELTSEVAQSVTLSLGSDDGYEAWLNGVRLGGYSSSRAYVARQDAFKVELKPGRNRLVVRIDQDQGPWAFGVQLDDKQGWPANIDWADVKILK